MSRPTLEERLQSLQQAVFGRNRELKEADPFEPTPMLLPLERIHLYDRNPRQERNEGLRSHQAVDLEPWLHGVATHHPEAG